VYPEEVVDVIADRCTQVDSGARNIDFIIDRTVLPEASKALLGRMTEEDAEMPERLVLGINENGDFTYTFDDEAPAVESAPVAVAPAIEAAEAEAPATEAEMFALGDDVPPATDGDATATEDEASSVTEEDPA
jgi:type VI secretion system protein VasG